MSITQVFFSEDLKDYINIDGVPDSKSIDSLRKINFFIGPNNSGKSRILRSMFWGRYDARILDVKTDGMIEPMNRLKALFENYELIEIGDLSLKKINLELKGIKMIFQDNSRSPSEEHYTSLADNLFNLRGSNCSSEKKLTILDENRIRDRVLNVSSTLRDRLRTERSNLTTNDAGAVYIPILRGMRPLHDIKDKDIYSQRSIADYFEKKREIIANHIFSGYRLYEEVTKLLLGDIQKRKLFREYEDFLSKQFFHKQVTIIPKIGEDVLLIKIGDEKERMLYDLGDGVQSIILMTFPIFIRKDTECTFYIEEPELNLHPAFQRKFLKTLSELFTNHQFFLTTHSNHFLEALSEYDNVALFSFKKSYSKDEFHVQKLTSLKNDILDNLGVRNSSVLMANCSIWVEGITDRLYIRKFLEIYIEHIRKARKEDFSHYREDQHYAFIEYAGSNIVHWSFDENVDENIKAASISNNILLIADSDFKNGRILKFKEERFLKLKAALGKNFHLIPGKEIENILHIKTIKKVIAEYEGIAPTQVTIKGNKTNYKKFNLGEWIDSNAVNLKRKYTNNSTIADKVNFCKKAIKHIHSFDDLSEEAKSLCRNIYDFIEKHNTDYIEKEE